MTDTNEQHLSDYLAILRRRKRQILRVAAAVFTLSVILAFVIPPVYRSEATILIEQQEVPQDLVQSTVTGYINQRLQIIQQRVLTHNNLVEIAQKSGLYPEKERSEENDGKVVGKMRQGIMVEVASANVTDPRSGRSTAATISFKLSYDADKPEVAQQVADELAKLFLNENVRMRTQQAESTSGFFSEEEERLGANLAELEAKLAEFKERNTGRLPELMNLNMSQLERTQRELEDVERQIYNLEERKLLLQGQLAQVEPYAGLNSPGGRLRMAQTEYLSATSKYSPDHPDVVRARREVEALKKEAGIQDGRDTIEAEYKMTRAQLDAARDKYAEDHPDVVRLKNSLAKLESKLKAAPASDSVRFAIKPDNPAYIALLTQLDTVNLNLKAAKEQRARAKEKASDYERRVVQTPKVEQEGLSLQREYESASKKYREIKQGLMGAETAVELEKAQRGGRFSLLEPATLPNAPRIPNRKAFILLGLVLGFGCGISYASYSEYMDRTIRGSRSVRAVLRTPPLAVIPYISPGGNALPGSGSRVPGLS
ncbi:MAG: Wzz/FepE/Etk N-terminal domain-containing protein [Woeseiaceae bacterium]|nr:Wzz/FepE/Etk N-terminal domain-containing protein [Woeseiaceae bacterium]